MALTRSDLTVAQEAEVNAYADALKAGAAKAAAIAAAQAALDAAQAKWRADAKGMTKTAYRAAVATRDAEIASLYAAVKSAERE